MAYQLTISKNDVQQAGANALARRRVEQCEQPLLRLGGKGCDLVLAGEEGELLRIETTAAGAALLRSDRLTQVRVGQEERPLPLCLNSGDEVLAGSWRLGYYVRVSRVGLSWQGTALARFSQLAVVVILVAQLFTAFVLPQLLLRSDPSGSAVARQRVAELLDALRQRATALASDDPLTMFLTASIRDELNARARYLRQHDDDLGRGQRREMLADLQQLGYLLDRVEQGETFPALPRPAVNHGVETLLKR